MNEEGLYRGVSALHRSANRQVEMLRKQLDGRVEGQRLLGFAIVSFRFVAVNLRKLHNSSRIAVVT